VIGRRFTDQRGGRLNEGVVSARGSSHLVAQPSRDQRRRIVTTELAITAENRGLGVKFAIIPRKGNGNGDHNCIGFCFQFFTARGELRKILFWRRQSVYFLFVYEISRAPLNGFAPNSGGRRAWFFARMSLKVKVKGRRSRSPGAKWHFRPFWRPACGLRLVKHL